MGSLSLCLNPVEDPADACPREGLKRETAEDGKELVFDHGAPFFSVTNAEVLDLVSGWEARGLVTEWKDKFGVFDRLSNKFVDSETGVQGKRYVGVPGMNSVCKALCNEPGVDSKFGVGVGKMEWLNDENSWMLIGYDGSSLGQFSGVVASDKNLASPRLGQPPPLDTNLVPELALGLRDIPVNPCFALMLAFSESLQSIPVKGFSIKNSEILSWAHCDSSKPGRSTSPERWVLHSTADYARKIIAQTGLAKPSSSTLAKVAEELYKEFESTGLNIPKPFFTKAHRWGSAFPAVSIARDETCLFDKQKRVAVCGDFCVSPSVEGAILSGCAAASKLVKMCSSL
uniref:Amine oxidase domain-containing protein n=1 Tax=Kalanchoe fedtschenkoi TaxID=63787 RepID=A0A7N0TJ64_KALFE